MHPGPECRLRPGHAMLSSCLDTAAATCPDRHPGRGLIRASTPSPTACDPDAAYDTQVSCSVVPGVIDASSTSSAPPPHIVRAAYRPPTTPTAATAYGPYAIQVGAFSESGQARFAATMAKQADYETLRGTQLVLQQAPALGRGIFWRARLAGLSHSAAASACQTLQNQGMACMLVPPGH